MPRMASRLPQRRGSTEVGQPAGRREDDDRLEPVGVRQRDRLRAVELAVAGAGDLVHDVHGDRCRVTTDELVGAVACGSNGDSQAASRCTALARINLVSSVTSSSASRSVIR